jgi:hypothetical protein
MGQAARGEVTCRPNGVPTLGISLAPSALHTEAEFFAGTRLTIGVLSGPKVGAEPLLVIRLVPTHPPSLSLPSPQRPAQ